MKRILEPGRAAVLTAGVAVGLAAFGSIGVLPAGASSKTVQIGNATAVSVPSGWTVSHPATGKVGLTHSSPKAVIEIAAGAGETGTVAANEGTNFSEFVKGFGMTHVKAGPKKTAQVPGGGKFDQASSIIYTSKYEGQTLGGIAVEYQNSTTGDGAFAVVVANQSDKSKLKKVVDQILASIATNS
jgi:hypothetical protein